MSKDIDAGNQAWVNGMKAGETAPIGATYADNAVDCGPTGECAKGRAAIEERLKTRFAKLGSAVSASAASEATGCMNGAARKRRSRAGRRSRIVI